MAPNIHITLASTRGNPGRPAPEAKEKRRKRLREKGLRTGTTDAGITYLGEVDPADQAEMESMTAEQRERVKLMRSRRARR